jgi:predicted MFS family arabinose efflux permease
VLSNFSEQVKQYLIITGNYWTFTLTDGALRMLVVLYFYQLGYSPLNIAMLFLFYEIFGVITNLVGGWLGARIGLNKTMNLGLALQIIALLMLTVASEQLSVGYVMFAQALSGIAKDLNKMSAKSAIKLLLPENAESKLFQWVALLTGSKNTLKGVGFFLGGILLTIFGFSGAVQLMAAVLFIVWLVSLYTLRADLGKVQNRAKFRELFSKSREINLLSAARLFLFAARDVWFVVALPVFLASTLGWTHSEIGGFLAGWIILYGVVQSFAPKLILWRSHKSPRGNAAALWAGLLALTTALFALAFVWSIPHQEQLQGVVIVGLAVFGVIFAINSSLHSYLIVAIADKKGVSLDVGFYYMANAMGRLLGTVLSGWVFQRFGLSACLWISFSFIVLAAFISLFIDKKAPTSSNI